MYRIELLCIGNLKESYLREACAEYLKRLTPYARVTVTELKEARTVELEGEAVLAALGAGNGTNSPKPAAPTASAPYVIALEIGGKSLSSEGFAEKLSKIGMDGKSHIVFIIGGSDGLSPAVLSRADLRLSFSQMTFPHQLMRVILLEQIYRAFRILRGEPYHK